MRYLALFLLALLCSKAFALGAHPESSVCSPEKPYQAICTHSLHNLEGWYGRCHTTEQAAQQDADKHAAEQHEGKSRWTGIKKAKFKGAAGY
jgi:hypothetical protein